jgi:hypothetical protein
LKKSCSEKWPNKINGEIDGFPSVHCWLGKTAIPETKLWYQIAWYSVVAILWTSLVIVDGQWLGFVVCAQKEIENVKTIKKKTDDVYTTDQRYHDHDAAKSTKIKDFFIFKATPSKSCKHNISKYK